MTTSAQTKQTELTALKQAMITVCAGIACLLAVQAVQADDDHRHHRSPDMGAQWWQFMSSIPAADNPLFDPTGAKCVIGQRGDVWFIGGVMGARDPDGTFLGGGGTATRSCTIPQGKKLFFPVINGAVFDAPGQCPQSNPSYTFDELVNQVSPYVDNAHDMVVTVDGKQFTQFQRITSKPFDITVPDASLWNQLCVFYYSDKDGLTGGIYPTAFQDGYYMTLDPLPVGDHSLRIQGTNGDFTLDVTYNLSIVATNTRKRHHR